VIAIYEYTIKLAFTSCDVHTVIKYIEDRLVDPFITGLTNILGTANITTGNQSLPSIYEIIIIP